MPKTPVTKKVVAFSLDISLIKYITNEAKKKGIKSKSEFVNDELTEKFNLGGLSVRNIKGSKSSKRIKK